MKRRAVIVGALLSLATASAQTSSVRIRVTNSRGTLISGATAALLDVNDHKASIWPADDKGEILFAGLPVGRFRFEVDALGFEPLYLTVSLVDREEATLDAQLKFGCVECGQEVKTVQAPTPDTLDLPKLSPQPKTVKRHWWQIFR